MNVGGAHNSPVLDCYMLRLIICVTRIDGSRDLLSIQAISRRARNGEESRRKISVASDDINCLILRNARTANE